MNSSSRLTGRILPVMSLLGNIASIVAVGIGFYAVVNPGAVSDYLDEIARNSESSSSSLESIDGSSSETAVNTGRLAGEVPYWIETEIIEPRASIFSIQLLNNSNFAFDDVRIKLINNEGIVTWSSVKFTVPPHESVNIYKRGVGSLADVVTYCVSGYSRAVEKKFYEERNLHPPMEYHVGLLYKGWSLSDKNTGICRN